VWLEIKTENISLPTELEIFRNDEKVALLKLIEPDTVLLDSDLLPSSYYNYRVAGRGIVSKEVTITTMDTISHDFTWETFTFGGEGGSSYLLDVAIINENNIWAVGIIYTADDNYNAVHWNGSQWELKKILYYGECSAVMYPPLKAIYAFSGEEIVLTNGGSIGLFDGNAVDLDCGVNPLLTGAINKIWGTSSSDFYVVGNNGNIAHYNGNSWMKIESGTALDFQDIWGDYNEKIQEWEVLAVASNKFFNEGNALLKIKELASAKLNTIGLPWSLSSICHIAGKKYFVGGDGLFFNKMLNENWNKDTTFIPIYKDRIRCSNINDIVVSGSNGLLSHYNGINWKHYTNNELPYFSGRLLSCDIKGNVIIAVGWKEIQAIITIGKR